MSDSSHDEYHHERVLRGIPRWLLREYLEDLGGKATAAEAEDNTTGAADVLEADGWQATLTQMDDFHVGSLSSGQVRLTVNGDPDEVRGMLARLAPRLTRGGG
jgi:hypothetical protein